MNLSASVSFGLTAFIFLVVIGTLSFIPLIRVIEVNLFLFTGFALNEEKFIVPTIIFN